jgi:hypothetical protein
MTFAAYARVSGSHGLGVEWIRVAVGSRELCECVAELWTARGCLVDMDEL